MSGKDKRTLVPRLRFPDFRKAVAWDAPQLRDISEPVVERVGDRKLTPVSISAGIGLVPQAEKFGRDISGNQYPLYTLVQDGDFVYNKGNSVKFPEGCIYDLQGWGEVAAPHVFICFRLKTGYLNGFFRASFEKNTHGLQLRKYITSGARSNGLLNINRDDFFSVRIPTPEPVEQQCIADCLSPLDDRISAESNKLDTLKAHKRGLMQRLFPAQDEAVPRLRFREFQKEGKWRRTKLSDILEKSVRSIDVDAGQTYREIGIRSHGRGVFHKEPVNGKALGDKRVFWVEEDAFVVNIVFAWEQAVAVTTAVEAGMIASHRFPMYKPKGSKSDVRFIKYFFLTKRGKELLGIASPGGAGRNKTLGQSEFEKLEFLTPDDVAEQAAIADALSSLDGLMTAQEKRVELLKRHKKGLMQQLFPVPEEVPA